MPHVTTRYERSVWVDEFPKSRQPAYPKGRGGFHTDVAIVGGGLTGCATAYACAAAGLKVALLEADRIGQGSSSRSTGWISDDPGVSFAAIEKAMGRRAARYAWQAWRRAALDAAALIRRLGVKCDLANRETMVIASNPEGVNRLKREHRIRRDAGLDASLVKSPSAAASGQLLGLRSRDGAVLNPYRAALGLAGAAAARGALVFERTPVRGVTFGRKTADVFLHGGSIRAGRVVIATGSPTPLFRALRRHFWFDTRYVTVTERIPAKIRRLLGNPNIVVRDAATPPHVVRWVDEERVLVAGAASEQPPDRLRQKTVVQRTGQLMYELSTIYPDISGIMPAYGWDAPYSRTEDGLPFIGAHRNYPFHLFAFGDSSAGVTGAFLASRILLRNIQDDVDRADEVFGFNRYGHVR
jgi:glycine/D-amino acid oxidase-like deaminating enzyme